MPKFTKPNTLNKVWSNNGDNTAPSDTKITLGWISEVPPRQTFNYLDNKQDQALAAINQSGVPEWDSVTEYQGNFSHVLGSDGNVYKAKTTNTNVNPVTDTARVVWKIAFAASDGTIPFTGKVTLINGTAASPAYGFATFQNTGIFGDAISGALAITVNGVEKARFSQSETRLKTALSLEAISTGVTPTFGDDSNKLATTEFVQDAVSNAAAAVISAGAVMAFAMNTAPTGWLIANGAAVSRTIYANLFAKIGTLYGAGDGSTTFNLPDYRGEFLRGLDLGRGVDAGRSIGTVQGFAIQSHTHTASAAPNGLHRHFTVSMDTGFQPRDTLSDPNRAIAEHGGTGGESAYHLGGSAANIVGGRTSDAGSHSHDLTIGSTGLNETRPRNVSVLYCIKF